MILIYLVFGLSDKLRNYLVWLFFNTTRQERDQSQESVRGDIWSESCWRAARSEESDLSGWSLMVNHRGGISTFLPDNTRRSFVRPVIFGADHGEPKWHSK